ncbi:MAG: hypothetical protein LBU84_19135 [Prevotella sp.]|jgi:hypothetical protein|nr:hypothetical protein [Prevotella sp.]
MQNYNEEYFYVISHGDEYPMLDYVNGGVMELFRGKPLDPGEVRIMRFADPIPRNPQLADHHFLTSNAPVISGRLKGLLESLNLKGIEFLPVIIQDKEGKEHNDYSIIHVLNEIQCMDKEKSKWDPSKYKPGRAKDVEKLVLDNGALDKIPLEERLVFTLWENGTNVLYHHSVVDKILEISPTGLTVYRLSRWNPDAPFIEGYVNDVMKRADKG